MALDELVVQSFAVEPTLFQHGLGDPAEQRHVAADPHLQVECAGTGCFEQRHLGQLMRDDRARRRGLHHRVDVDDLRAPPISLGQRRQHAWSVGGGVDAHDEQGVRDLPVLEIRGSLAGA